jgi:hypothetical protein
VARAGGDDFADFAGLRVDGLGSVAGEAELVVRVAVAPDKGFDG